jgi:NADPH:quinone reductase
MLGIGLAYEIPIVSIVRSAAGEQELRSLGAKNVLVKTHAEFDRDLAAVTEAENATAIFDGAGGELLNRILPLAARGSTVFVYGYLGGTTPISVPSGLLMAKGLTIKSFSNFGSQTVRDPDQLKEALNEIGRIIEMPHFKTKGGKSFSFDEIADAFAYRGQNGGKAILEPQRQE